MHDATQTLLSKIEQGQKILVVEPEGMTSFEFGRPKDPAAVPRSVTKIEKIRDQWTGHTYVVQITGGRRNTGRYGTTHVYVPKAKVEPQKYAPEVELDLAVSGTKRVKVAKDGTMRVVDWDGGDVTERTPKGRLVRIAADGVLTILEDFPEDDEPSGEEAAAIALSRRMVEDDDAPAQRPATDDEAATAERCHQCKGYGVVRKTGSKAGKAYRTLVGAEESTTKGNSEKCPVCKGATLLVRAA